MLAAGMRCARIQPQPSQDGPTAAPPSQAHRSGFSSSSGSGSGAAAVAAMASGFGQGRVWDADRGVACMQHKGGQTLEAPGEGVQRLGLVRRLGGVQRSGGATSGISGHDRPELGVARRAGKGQPAASGPFQSAQCPAGPDLIDEACGAYCSLQGSGTGHERPPARCSRHAARHATLRHGHSAALAFRSVPGSLLSGLRGAKPTRHLGGASPKRALARPASRGSCKQPGSTGRHGDG